jgi:hypothetical protein
VSKYGLTQTVLREEKYLVEALKEMGYEVHEHDSIYGGVYGWAAHRHVPLEIRGLTCLATLVIVSERRGAGCLTRGLSFRLGMVRERRHSKGDSLSM